MPGATKSGEPSEKKSDIQQESEVGFEIVNRVGIVTLNRPRALNALSHEMIVRLTQVFEFCRNEDTVAAIVLRGALPQCAGASQ
ncbi:enoyl-CoA hydratase/isomerase family protein [Paraburkholderia domus]|uniref:enoyl-CoA hydratase/isomerase family protein n=1 Tax=Paraburkholderia domus TaxID=2793075 RepID=UPI001EF00A67|nr:enoyl-CoA hydratase/isomerase family protein [Paraburkholderia domus]